MKTKTILIEDESFTFAKLTLDDVEEWDDAMRALTKTPTTIRDVHAVQRKACSAALSRAGRTDPAAVGRLDIDGLTTLVREVMTFSHVLSAQGEAQSP
jgi:hypothetical protein